MKAFMLQIGSFDWLFETTEKDIYFNEENYSFMFRKVVVAKKVSVKERNLIFLKSIIKAGLLESNMYWQMYEKFSEKEVEAFVTKFGTILQDIIVDKNLARFIKTQYRKERYNKKIKRGYKPRKQLKLKFYVRRKRYED